MARTTVREAHRAIARRETFTAASMGAGTGRPVWLGHLPADWESSYFRDTRDGQAYVVYSYGTPIGWERADGTRVIPRVTYSITTTRHQSQLRRAWNHTWRQEYSNPTRGLLNV